jgi:hypothetical protein
MYKMYTEYIQGTTMRTHTTITLHHIIEHDTPLDEEQIKDRVMDEFDDLAYEIESIWVGMTEDKEVGNET